MIQKRSQPPRAASTPPDLAGSDMRLRREGALALVLALVIVAASMAYVAAAVTGTRALQTRNALERSESMARLCARLLDEQCDTAISVLEALAERPDIATKLRNNDRASLREYLKDAVDLVPDLRLAALFDSHGEILMSYPKSAPFPNDAVRHDWFREANATRKPFIGDVAMVSDPDDPSSAPVDVMVVVLPVGGASPQPGGLRFDGFLLAYYRLGDMYAYLRQVHLPGATVLIVRPNGQIAASSTGSASGIRISESRAQAIMHAGEYGAQVDSGLLLPNPTDPRAGATEIVGYASAARTGWKLFTLQSTDAAYAPSDSLLRRLLLLTFSLGGLVALTSWMLIRLYRRQQTLAAILADRNEQLRRADRAKSDLLANVSHDLKTPIASIQLSVSGLLEADTEGQAPGMSLDPGEVKECLTIVSHEMNELSGRVRNLLEMTLLESGGPELLRQPCDMTDIVAMTLERLRSLLRERTIDAIFPQEPLFVDCDPPQMETVVMNLLENAHKYSPGGATIHLSGTLDQTDVVFRIRDEGPGIPAVDRARIFDKFYRNGTLYAAGGTGLGLSICRAIVEEHGGTIICDDTPGRGAEFVVRLPGALNGVIL